MAETETNSLASSYRVTASSVTRALTAGESVPSLRGFLAEISLTGIPQPLEYLLTDTAARFGTLRVGTLDPGVEDESRPWFAPVRIVRILRSRAFRFV